MSSFEWMELQTLTNDIELARSRLTEARSHGDQGRVRALEVEIARAEKTRLQLLTHISTNIASAAEPKATEGADSEEASAPAAEAVLEEVKAEQPPPEPASAPEPAPVSKAKERAGSRQATASAAEAVPVDAKAEQPPPELATAAEPAPDSKATEGANSREASAPVAEALPDEASAAQPPPEPASAAEPAPLAKARERAGTRQGAAAVAEAVPDEATAEPPPPEPVDRLVASGAASPNSAQKADGAKGGNTVWDQLKPSDIERVKNELGVRREEMLARHAEELKGLDAEQSQLETLEQAIESFLQKMNQPAPASTVVELRQQGND
jgi:hypothetical protein